MARSLNPGAESLYAMHARWIADVLGSDDSRRLRRYLAGRLAVHLQWWDKLHVNGSVRIKPDLVFGPISGVITYVADTKYKVTADGFGREADYYQILAYASALNLPEGLLIYCQHDGNIPPQQVEVRNLGTRLRTWAVPPRPYPLARRAGTTRAA
jgi:5-methylcytosine-specific restriction endonuclease McrBC regulatory subunit McrC